MIREPVAAGRFYPGEAAALAAAVDRCAGRAAGRADALAVIVPHAGYVYSGPIAGAVFARIAIPPRVLLLGPNHTGLGAPRALAPEDGWRTPLGVAPLDAALGEALGDAVARDGGAHRFEHSLEVEVPFLQRARPDVALAALCLAHLSAAACEQLGEAVAAAVRARPALLVASTDMSHYLPARTAAALDHLALERIVALDPQGLYEVVHREGISMCGVIPTTVTLFAARALGATRAELVRYGHSGEATGDDAAVVGYAGLIVS